MSANDWFTYYSERASKPEGSAFWQVGKTVEGLPVGYHQLRLIARAIQDGLDLKEGDSVIDFGCGNGLTWELASQQNWRVIGVDFIPEFGEKFVKRMNKKGWNNSVFFQSEISEMGHPGISDASKALIYEVVQHLTSAELTKTLRAIHEQTEIETLFLGGIPDANYKDRFEERYIRPVTPKSANSTVAPDLGNWYSRLEMQRIALETGFQAQIQDQHRDLYTQHYRYDAILKKVT